MKRLSIIMLMLLCFVGMKAQKQISILGDSYSTFEGYAPCDTFDIWYFKVPLKNRTDVTDVKQTWWHKFIKKHNYRLCVNNSFSGSTICFTGYRKEDYSNRSFVNRMKELGNCPDIIFIFGGTNDSWAGSPIGEYKYSDWANKDLYSFRPAMAYMLDYMTTRYLNTEIYFIVNNKLKPEITNSIHDICNHYNVKYLDLKDIDKKGNHPSVKGMEQIVDQLDEFLNLK